MTHKQAREIGALVRATRPHYDDATKGEELDWPQYCEQMARWNIMAGALAGYLALHVANFNRYHWLQFAAGEIDKYNPKEQEGNTK